MIRNLILSLITSLYSCGSYAQKGIRIGEPPTTATNARFLFLDGVITGQTIAPLQEAMQKVITSKSKAAVTILINSPGGSVIAGMAFINRMQTVKALDIEINCYVLDVAASMAFQILTQCTNRYTLPTSFLLWHGVRMGSREPITTSLARSIADDLQRMDDVVLMQLDDALSLDSDTIRKHFEHETLWSGAGLHTADPSFITPADAYPTLLPNVPSAVQMGQESFFFGQEGADTGMIYIWSGWKDYLNGKVSQ